jgi:hypothetical protein
LYVRGVRGGEKSSKIIKENSVNIPIVSLPVALTIIYEINPILPLSLGCFEMEILGISITMLEPFNFCSLGPPLFLLKKHLI